MPDRVRITEVAPRDGLQNEPGVIPTADKVRLIELCAATGVDEVEVTSFVSPKWIPQLADAPQVVVGLLRRFLDSWPVEWPMFSALIPNEQGFNTLWKTLCDQRDVLMGSHPNFWAAAEKRSLMSMGFIDKLSVFTAASETFARKNINASINESIDRFREILSFWPAMNRPVRGYVSCAIACPFEGPIHPQVVADVARRLVDIGITEIDLGDTIGAADVASTTHLLEVMREVLYPSHYVTLHLHDTFGRAADCVKAALDLGIRSFDASVAGLGGCPYASTPGKRAPGNISTETLVRTVHDAGYATGVDLDRLREAAAFATRIVAAARGSGGPTA